VDDTPLARFLAALAAAATLSAMLWLEMPPWQRQLMAAAVRAHARAAAAQAARLSGLRAMGRELKGIPEHDAGYQITARLSGLRDRL